MSDDEIEYARGVIGAATPGPWSAERGGAWTPWSGEGPIDAMDGPPGADVERGWTVSNLPGNEGWETDGGLPEYGITLGDARAIALLGSTAREALAVIEAVDLMRLSCTWDDACPEEGITCASEMALGGSGCDSCVTLAALDTWREAVRRHRGGGE